MRNKTKPKEPHRRMFEYIEREEFMVDGTSLIVQDRLNTYLPWSSERILWVAGTDAYYSVAPLCPAWHRLLCFTFCEDALKEKEPGFYHHALALGCGGGAVPRWLLEEYPELRVDVVDRSPEIIEVCKKYFLQRWKSSERLKFYCTDARDYEPPDYPYEFIFCDLFDGRELAPVVCEKSFAQKLSQMTADGGLLLINCGWGHKGEVKQLFREGYESVQMVDREPGQTDVIRAEKPRHLPIEGE